MQSPGLLLKGQWLGPTRQPRHEDALERPSISGFLSEPITGDAICYQLSSKANYKATWLCVFAMGCGGTGVRSSEHHYVCTGWAELLPRPPFHTVARWARRHGAGTVRQVHSSTLFSTGGSVGTDLAPLLILTCLRVETRRVLAQF